MNKIYTNAEKPATMGFGNISLENSGDGDEIFDEFWNEVIAGDSNGHSQDEHANKVVEAIDRLDTLTNNAFNAWREKKGYNDGEE